MLYDAKGNPIPTRAKRFLDLATRKEAAGEFIANIDQLPNPSKLLKDKGETIAIFEQVARQIDVAAAIQDYKSGISSMDYTIQSSEDNSDRAAFFLAYCDSINIDKIIKDALKARDYGYAILEITRWKQFRGFTVPAGIEAKPQRWFGFDQQNELRFYTKKSPREGIRINALYPGKFINPRYNDEYDNPYGTGLLDLAYWHCVGLNGNFEFMMTFLEEDGRDKWVLRHARNASQEEINAGLNAAYNLRNNGVAAVPEGNEFEKKEVSGRSSSIEAYTRADELLTRKIQKLWYGTDLMMQVDGKGGYSSSQSGIEIRGEALESGKTIARDVLHQIFSTCCRLNNIPGSDDETITFELVASDDYTKEEAERDQIIIQVPGFKPTQKFFLNRGYQEDEFTYDPEQAKEPDATFGTDDAPVDLLKAYDLVKKKP